MTTSSRRVPSIARGLTLGLMTTLLASTALAQTPDYRARLPQDEVIYFLMPDMPPVSLDASPLSNRSGIRK